MKKKAIKMVTIPRNDLENISWLKKPEQTEANDITVDQSDQAILAIIKANRKTLFRLYSRKMGYETWYDEFKNSYRTGFSAKEQFIAADNYNRLSYMFARFINETSLFAELD